MRSLELIPTRSSVPRMWGVLEVVAGAIAVIGALLSGPGTRGASVALTTGPALALIGAVAILVPWQRLPARATLIVPVAALAFLVLQLIFGADQLLRLGIALWLAGLTGETIAWRAEVRRREEQTQQAERREELVRSMVQTSSDATIMIDGLGVITSASPSVTATLGYDPADLLESTIHALVSAEDAATILAMQPRPGTHSDGRLDCQVLHHDGRWLRAEVQHHEPARQGRPRPHDPRRDPLEGARGAAHAAGVPRSAHRPRQPRPVRRPPRSTPSAGGGITRRAPPSSSSTSTTSRPSTTPSATSRAITSSAWWPPASRETIRPEDTAARLGGDEFALLLEDVDEDQAVERRQPGPRRARPAVRAERPPDAHRDDDRHRPELAGPADGDRHAPRRRHRDVRGQGRRQGPVPRLRAVDAARDGRAPAAQRRPARRRRARRVRPPLPAHRQPADGATVTGVEALVRWAHPVRGLVPPLEFIPLAERTGPHHPARRMGPPRGVPAGPRLAARPAGPAAADDEREPVRRAAPASGPRRRR